MNLDTTEEWNIKNGMAQVIPFLYNIIGNCM